MDALARTPIVTIIGVVFRLIQVIKTLSPAIANNEPNGRRPPPENGVRGDLAENPEQLRSDDPSLPLRARGPQSSGLGTKRGTARGCAAGSPPRSLALPRVGASEGEASTQRNRIKTYPSRRGGIFGHDLLVEGSPATVIKVVLVRRAVGEHSLNQHAVAWPLIMRSALGGI